ncbi:hypothetical protein [Salinicola sp. RZ23]|uniref:hypothetical protein n=1 Tax=Salinicola sp. RZ23 TaxID=1949087 RepID=UPI000DA11E46|nr:hypothetical protein [Salinicola sp. RZ23]
MYFVEWLMRRTLTASKKDITGFEGDMKQFEKATEKYGKQYRGMQERQISDAPSDARSIYRMNDTYMDIRTFFDEWRGGVLLGFFPLIFGVVFFLFLFFLRLLAFFLRGRFLKRVEWQVSVIIWGP